MDGKQRRAIAQISSVAFLAVFLARPGYLRATDFAKSPAKVATGKALFFDKRLSFDGSTSCATCHNPELAYTDGLQVAIGNKNLPGTRNTPTLFASSDQLLMFHDGRTLGTPLQSTQPLANRLEMGHAGFDEQGQARNQTLGDVLRRIRRIPGYRGLFAKAYPEFARGSVDRLISPTTYGQALAAFMERTKSRSAPIDRRMEGYKTSLSRQAERGYQVFLKSGCVRCHSGRDFTDAQFHNNGFTFLLGEGGRDSLGRIAVVSDQLKQLKDTRAFKTPTLREVALTGPYMHNGRIGTLREVLDIYNAGARVRGMADPFIDQGIQPLNLPEKSLDDLEVFLVEAMGDKDQSWKITEPVQP